MKTPDKLESNLPEEWLTLVLEHAPHLRNLVANYRAARSRWHRQQIANTLVPNALDVTQGNGAIALTYYQLQFPAKVINK